MSDDRPDPAQTGKAAPKSWRRWLWRGLVGLSFGLNLLVIGLILGLALSGGKRDDTRPPPLRAGGIAPLVALLPPEARQSLGQELRQQSRDHGVSRRTRSAERQQLARLIAAEPFDGAAVIAHLDGAAERGDGFNRAGHRALVAELGRLSAAERAAYATRLQRFDRFRKPHGERPDKRKPWPDR